VIARYIRRLFMLSLSRICSHSQTFSVINPIGDRIRRLIGQIIITYRYDTDKDGGSSCAGEKHPSSGSRLRARTVRVSRIKTSESQDERSALRYSAPRRRQQIIPRGSPSIPPSLIPAVAFIVAVIELPFGFSETRRRPRIALAAMRACARARALLALISDY